MKRSVVYRLVAAFFCLAFLGSVHAQSLKTFNREVCSGATLFLDGGLYQILTNDCEIISIKANGTGSELYDGKADKRITLTATTKYHIQYKDNAHPGGTVAYAQITVITPPTLKVTVTSPKPLPTALCKDTKVTLNATQSNADVYWTISSDEANSKKGTSAEFTLTESCWISAQSYNACGFVDTSIYFPVITGADLSKARLILKNDIKEKLCIGCGFFPKAEEIIAGATQGTIKSSSITWEDGSTTEETINTGVISKNLKVHAVIEQESAGCGVSATATKVIDTVLAFTIPGGVDCKPTMQTAVSVMPCRDGEVQLKNLHKGVCTIQGKPTLAANPAHPKIVIGEKTPFPYQETNSDIYRWNIRWENYAKTDAQPSLTANAGYSIACPYSKNKPSITGTFEQKVNVVIDTAYITFKYEYCPDGNADLEIKGQKDIVTIKDVALVGVSGGFSSMFNATKKENHQWTCVSVDAITTALVDKYSPLRFKVTYEVKDGNCQFTLVREEVVRLKQRDNCNMKFLMNQSGACIGEPRTFELSPANGAVADYIEIEPHPVFTFKVNAEQRTMEPYYAGAPGVELQKDSIIATIYYHLQGSSGTLSMTKKFPLEVKACPPYFTGDLIINNDKNCPLCPGAAVTGAIEFKNSTTHQDKTNISFITTAETQTDPTQEFWKPRGPMQQYLQYQLWRYMFNDAEFRVEVTYNEGDSVYTLPALKKKRDNADFGINNRGLVGYGEMATPTAVRMANICSIIKKVEKDSVCNGEKVQFYIYSQNLFETLESIQWVDKAVTPVGTGKEELEYSYGNGLKKKIQAYHYEVTAQGDGIYPFVLRTKIRDKVIERKDTIRVTILAKPHIFIQDTVYACSNASVNLWKYVDSSAVDVKTLTCSVGMVINSATDRDYRAATANLRYHCTDKNIIKETINIRTQDPVYNAFIPDGAYCPGDQVELNAKTNGHVTWTKRYMLEGGGLSQADTLVADGENKVISDEMGESSQFYTVTARTGCNQPPFQTVQFWANVKPGPEITVQDNSACGSETVTLKADYDADKAGSLMWKADGKPVSQPYVVRSPDPSRDYTMKVEATVKGTLVGVNDCPSSATAEIKFFASPTVAIQGKNSTGVLCVDSGVSVRIQAQGGASNQYGWYLKGNPTAPLGKDAVLNRAFDKDTFLYVVAYGGSCTVADSARIVLNGKKRAVADTTVCVGSAFSFYMPAQEGVSYKWYLPDGKFYCPCRNISFTEDEPFAATDAGTYKVEIIRNGCTVTQNIDLKAYPVPVMDFGTTEDPVRVCEGNPLVLRMQPKIDGKEVSGYFVWADPVGTEVLSGDDRNTYVKDPVLMVDRGSYTAFVTLQNGCTHSASINVRVDEHTQPEFSLKPYYCEGEMVDLNAVYQGDGSTYEWFSEAGRQMGPAADLHKASLSDLTPKESGRLYLVVTRGACKDTTYRNLEVRERPTAEVEVRGGSIMDGELFFCEGQSVLLALKNVLEDDATRWVLPNGDILQDADDWHTNKVALSDGGEYSVEVVRNGCASEVETVNLDVRVVPVLILQDTFLCQGRDIVVNVENTDYPGAVYTWRELSVQSPEVRLDRAGEYHIVMSLRGCSDEGSFLLSERPVPEWDFPADTSICNRDSLLLQGPEGMDSYQWQDGSRARSIVVRDEGLYTLTVTHAGCANEKSVYVETEFCTPIFFPSAFTPNGDGINDAFGPISLAEEGELEYAFFVYNANGQLMFQSTDIRSSWDGTFKGKPCPAGIYTYRCKIIVSESGRDLSRIGTVHLLR